MIVCFFCLTCDDDDEVDCVRVLLDDTTLEISRFVPSNFIISMRVRDTSNENTYYRVRYTVAHSHTVGTYIYTATKSVVFGLVKIIGVYFENKIDRKNHSATFVDILLHGNLEARFLFLFLPRGSSDPK